MVFSSISFLFFFLPFFLISYFALGQRNAVFLVFSLIFYAWGDIAFVPVLLCSLFANYLFGLLIAGEWGGGRKLWLALGVGVNISILAGFKYAGFIVENVNHGLAWVSLLGDVTVPPLSIGEVHLPLGISFFTFQAISYLVDVYRREVPAERNPLNVALYISMFPQLIAGPIVRFATVSDALHRREVTLRGLSEGIQLFIIGLAQKVLIANSLAVPADEIFALPAAELTAPLAWTGAISYSLQIYFDFSGYSNMAIGLGLMLGFRFPRNFNFPYIAQSVRDFWRRWHMSLSSWFRDYLYIPLGGDRKGPLRTFFNLLIVFFLCGLWHGASWSFVVWGLYHGVFIALERYLLGGAIGSLPRPLRHLYLLLVVIGGWVLFRAGDLSHAGEFLWAMVGQGEGAGVLYPLELYLHRGTIIALAAGVLFSTPLPKRVWQAVHGGSETKPMISRWTVGLPAAASAGLLLLVSMRLASGAHNPFIYFRF